MIPAGAGTLLLCLVLAQAAVDPTANTIAQAYSLARLLQADATDLLQAYLSAQGPPFSAPGFAAPALGWAGVPGAALPFPAWRGLGDGERLRSNQVAYAAYEAFLAVVADDQAQLHPGRPQLLARLARAQAQVRGLQASLGAVMAALGVVPGTRPPPVAVVTTNQASAFERKCRGYVVCREYRAWLGRTVQDLTLLRAKYLA